LEPHLLGSWIRFRIVTEIKSRIHIKTNATPQHCLKTSLVFRKMIRNFDACQCWSYTYEDSLYLVVYRLIKLWPNVVFLLQTSMDKRGGKGLSEKCENTLHTLVREVQVSYHYIFVLFQTRCERMRRNFCFNCFSFENYLHVGLS
jgi:hypothetical protein